MNFDRLAPHYRWMERAFAGRALHRCRVAFLDRVAPRRVLLPGEGHGRFLFDLLRHHPHAQVTVVDASAAMLREARGAVGRCEQVEFIHADLLEWNPPRDHFDLIATSFLLDCFTPAQLDPLIATLAKSATCDATWLVADFREPVRWHAKLLVWALYRFFRWTTHIDATQIAPPDAFLERHGFMLRERRVFDWGLLHSDWWIAGPIAVRATTSPPS
ncbi:MAG: class I SAM-dependent methyltransferase [Chthoniobacteraceae bacterium]